MDPSEPARMVGPAPMLGRTGWLRQSTRRQGKRGTRHAQRERREHQLPPRRRFRRRRRRCGCVEQRGRHEEAHGQGLPQPATSRRMPSDGWCRHRATTLPCTMRSTMYNRMVVLEIAQYPPWCVLYRAVPSIARVPF